VADERDPPAGDHEARARRPELSVGVGEAAVRIEPLTKADVTSAVDLAVRVLRVRAGDRGEQFAADITGERRQMFVAKASDLVVAYGRVLELAADEAGPGTPAGCYLSGVLVEPAWRGRGIATALTRARLRWAFARTGTVFYVTGADNAASLHLHAAFGFQEIKRLASERSAAGVDVLSQLERPAAHSDDGPFIGGPVDHGSEVRNPGSLPACSQPTGGTPVDRMRQLRAWRAGLSFSAAVVVSWGSAAGRAPRRRRRSGRCR
jgi:aminoglycoside 6'-N-acetyltransferase I